jgi:phosphoenolpyruvate carboxykinase (GTP)
MGPDRLALLPLRRRDHRQRLRRDQHVDHDAHGPRGPRAASRAKAKFVRGLHSTGELDPEPALHHALPEELAIESYGSGYGGNALLGKKCHALRIASWQARDEGWLAEHMLIVGIENPQGETHYIAAAFPVACGKTNLAMLIPPDSMPGWKIWTVGDDIAWLHPGPDGRLYAINPEAGYFGVVPGTNRATNRNAFDMIHRDTLFTNVALTADNEPWWEGRKLNTPVLDWQGKPFDAKAAACPRIRIPASPSRRRNNPIYSPHSEDAMGVPISALVFGGRPARSRAAGVRGAQLAARRAGRGVSGLGDHRRPPPGAVGVVRRDPMAMKPFAGYNFATTGSTGSTWAASSSHPPKLFHVNWFPPRCPGKIPVARAMATTCASMEWILKRCTGAVGADESAIGQLPRPGDLNLQGVDVSDATLRELLAVQPAAWRKEAADMREYLKNSARRSPAEMSAELGRDRKAVGLIMVPVRKVGRELPTFPHPAPRLLRSRTRIVQR